jgi:hypothetical protein
MDVIMHMFIFGCRDVDWCSWYHCQGNGYLASGCLCCHANGSP